MKQFDSRLSLCYSCQFWPFSCCSPEQQTDRTIYNHPLNSDQLLGTPAISALDRQRCFRPWQCEVFPPKSKLNTFQMQEPTHTQTHDTHTHSLFVCLALDLRTTLRHTHIKRHPVWVLNQVCTVVERGLNVHQNTTCHLRPGKREADNCTATKELMFHKYKRANWWLNNRNIHNLFLTPSQSFSGSADLGAEHRKKTELVRGLRKWFSPNKHWQHVREQALEAGNFSMRITPGNCKNLLTLL